MIEIAMRMQAGIMRVKRANKELAQRMMKGILA